MRASRFTTATFVRTMLLPGEDTSCYAHLDAVEEGILSLGVAIEAAPWKHPSPVSIVPA